MRQKDILQNAEPDLGVSAMHFPKLRGFGGCKIDLDQPHLGQNEAEGGILRTTPRKVLKAVAVPPIPILGFDDRRLSAPSKFDETSGYP